MRTLTLFAAALIGTAAFAQTPPWHDLGRDATKAEVQAWDIDVRPDFKGLPKGAGSVALGERVWEAHRSHYYQRLVRAGFGHRGTLAVYGALMVGCGATADVSVR